MKTTRIFSIFVASILLLFNTFLNHYAYGKDIGKMIDSLLKDIAMSESILKKCKIYKQKIDSGKYYSINERLIPKDDLIKDTDAPWEVAAKIDEAKKITKADYNRLLRTISLETAEIAEKKKELAKLEKEINQRHQEGHAFVEVKINQEKFSRPGKNLVRWDWTLRFDEINGVGVTIKKGWARGYRGGELKLNKVDPLNLRIEPYGSTLFSKPYMQYGIVHDKTSPGKMKYVYSGIDDNGNEVKTELEITRSPK